MDERVQEVLAKPWVVPSGGGILTFGLGVGVGYILGKRTKVETPNFPEQLQIDFSRASEIQTVEPPSPRRVLTTPLPEEDLTEEDIQRASDEFIARHLGEVVIIPDEEVEDVTTEVEHNIFAEEGDGWDYDVEVASRKSTEPYVIHQDEFYSDESGLDQVTLCYYAADDIMCDEQDSPIYNYKLILGELKFGHGSGDPNVVYIRNEARRGEYEVLYHSGSFAEEVHGLELEKNLRHSQKTPKFKFE